MHSLEGRSHPRAKSGSAWNSRLGQIVIIMSRPSPLRFHAIRRGRTTIIAVSIMIAWHLVADVEMGITLGILAWLLWPGKAA